MEKRTNEERSFGVSDLGDIDGDGSGREGNGWYDFVGVHIAAMWHHPLADRRTSPPRPRSECAAAGRSQAVTRFIFVDHQVGREGRRAETPSEAAKDNPNSITRAGQI